MDDLEHRPAPAGATSTATSTRRGGRLRRIVVGRDGIRGGWLALLFIAIVAGVAFGLSFAARHVVPRPANFHAVPPGAALLSEGIQVAAAAMATAVLAAIERKSFLAFGLQGVARGLRFASGAVCGFAAISVLVLTLRKAGLLQLNASTLQAGEAWKYAAMWAAVFVMAGLFEESVLRGYLQYTLARSIGFGWAAILLSVLFGALHGWNPGETPVGLVTAVLAGLVFCLSLWYTGSLWWAIGFHAAWDWGESYFYGTPDSGEISQGSLFTAHPVGNVLLSGGATGPEGSVLIFPVLIVVAALMWAWWGRRKVKAPLARHTN
ncbi:CPBP family intramembrane glutamic endopeptidase [Trinickia mobilis]|uniref:CPBP family intramembrane glutamic endopeptidase n=1 Tax=Trinickia mobilis TaxID=2816356 RepID=UPI001A9056F0|nr:type II CAAX endopeptidase family protein [Trinickia mobilis]